MFARIPKFKGAMLGFVWVLLAAPLLIGWYVHAAATSTAGAEASYDLQPVINSETVPPLVMLVMSRDEQLYNKAYSDYTDLHEGETSDPGVIDATYDDTFSYAGYFDSSLCYSYNSGATSFNASSLGVQTGTGMFKADNSATGTNLHYCSSEWSGNFLNWLSMSRLDIVRRVLYGGLRSIDSATQTVLERAAIPNDLHAWVKVYSGSDIASLTPFSYDASNPVSFCNASIYSSSGVPSTAPLMRVARGNYSEWSATQDSQCNWHDTDGDSNNPATAVQLGGGDITVRVDVCDETGTLPKESFCRLYTNTSTGTSDYKPAGLLQQYGEGGKMRFGLMTGSYADPRTGGRLRRNIGLFAGNGSDPTTCTTGDEVKLSNGTFCNHGAGVEGIVNTLSRLKLVGWQSNTAGGGSGWIGDGAGDNCYAWGGRARNGNGGTWVMDNPGGGDRHCSAYGNPLSEIYAEAVRYIEGNGNSATAGYVNGNDTSYITGIPDKIDWIDPYGTAKTDTQGGNGGGNAYCASCSILVLSTGLNSFDSDELPTDSRGINALTATDEVGTDEGIAGKDFLIGRVLGKLTDNGTTSPASLVVGASVDTNADLCTAKTIDKLSNAIGVCPDVPSLEGSYYIAGLAFKAWTTDLRPDLETSQSRPSTFKNNVQTYTVALAESLPSFNVPVSTGTVNFSPLCQSNTNGSAVPTDANWSTCALGAVEVGTKTSIVSPNLYTYGRPVLSDNSAGSFSFLWEDSTFGSDHDLDATDMITWCVGTACSYQSAQTQAGTRKNISGTTFTGYDICWRSDHTSTNADYSAVCGGSDQPSVAANEVLVRIETMSTAGGYAMLTGYNISGTASDGSKRIALAPGSFNSILTGQVNPPAAWYLPRVVKFTLGTTNVGRLQNPLYYAAKYGGFAPAFNSDGTPNSPVGDTVGGTGVWDAVSNITGGALTTGACAPGDCLPDNFFPVHNPSLLASQLGAALNAILKRTGSGTAAAVVSNTVNGDGLVYKALYRSDVTDNDATVHEVNWSGDVNSLWTDSFGLLREDGNHNDVLDGYDQDPIVVFFTDTTDNSVKFNECKTSDPTFDPKAFDPSDIAGTCPGNSGATGETLDHLNTVWDAQKQLWDASATWGVTQRSYGSDASTGRYIFTWIDANHNGVVDSGEQTAFVWSGSGATCSSGFCGKNTTTVGQVKGNFGFLNSDDPAEAQNIVNWTRGENDISGMRSRTINPAGAFIDSGTTTDQVLRLGDIIDSTPQVVGRPAEQFDVLYGDSSYATFRAQYRDRRTMVYVGANDGMLHALNGGYFDSAFPALCTLFPDTGTAASPCSSSSGAVAQPLGSEIWAYVPGNLLPHLRWLTDINYKSEHVFYVDGNPVATDAKVFADDATHPGGWGTILVVPFRLGGGMIETPTPLTDDGTAYKPSVCKPANCVKQKSYSSYVVLDVTDPEQAPTVLAELHPASDDGNGQSFTTSVPAFAVMRDPSSGNPDKFFMFIGSGPTGVTDSGVSTSVTSNAPLRLYAYDLGCITGTVTSGCGATSATPLRSFDLSNGGVVAGAKNSFAGDLIASDFDLNDRAEAVYFGSVRDPQTGGSPIEFQGSMWKLKMSENTDATTWTTELMYDVNKPISIRPTLGLNSRRAPEVFFGTGRLFSKDDLKTTGQQQIVGLIDPELLPGGDAQADFALPLGSGDLLDSTNVEVCGVGGASSPCGGFGAVTGAGSATNFTDLQALFDMAKAAGGKAGFMIDLSAPGTTPAERVVSAQALLGGILITNTYTPGTDTCTNIGEASEFAVNYKTGTGDPNSQSFGVSDGSDGKTAGTVETSKDIGRGLPAAPSLHVGTGTGNHVVTACTQTSTGAIICQKITTLSPINSSEISWREPLDK